MTEEASNHQFLIPAKRINDGQDVQFWLSSKAYSDIMTFILRLNTSMFPQKLANGQIKAFPLDPTKSDFSKPVLALQQLLSNFEKMIDEAPPDLGPRRFGNVSFRKWYEIAESRSSDLLDECLPVSILSQGRNDEVSAKDELKSYLLGGFGSPQRLDYGTGHELSFLAFVAGMWKLNGFPESSNGTEEVGIILGVIEPYLNLVRRLIRTYTLEPAGSHGVWGLDDHAFLPYIFGSAQLSAPRTTSDQVPQEGSAPSAPRTGDVVNQKVVSDLRSKNMYFSAIGFIYDVKKGPFWEHSPMLFDISGVTAGWAKINKGMLKMYNAEVLSKFPVVQHFPFGSLFRWEHDPNAPSTQATTHTSNQPKTDHRPPPTTFPNPPPPPSGAPGATRAPWATATRRPGV